ncbi:MAG: imidazolonepropionase [Bacteroidetes bacterium]|jgi:imidazolonepropionase|nr:imidazolonepropionase [Bacteroidota bacterium]MDA0828084.1 imidazolonepropionase [Bacteroidota bacterium]MDA1198593.1 imidazolonepropionase [Bacteroidota bacterium]
MRTRLENLDGLALCYENGQSPAFLAGQAMDQAPVLKQAYLDMEGGFIVDFGAMDALDRSQDPQGLRVIDGQGRWAFPAFIDSHTHLVYAQERSGEFEQRMRGATYAEIAAAGGGILNSAQALEAMSEDALLQGLLKRLNQARNTGTAVVEIKSGYGLTLEAELKMLRVVQRAKTLSRQPLFATFLGAHAVPARHSGNTEAYFHEVLTGMLPRIAAEGLADFVDLFCEESYFRPDQLRALADAAQSYGLPLKAHVNQFTSIGGIQAAIASRALSVDHLEVLTDDDLADLTAAWSGQTGPMPVALPGCSLFLQIPYTPGRRIIDAGLPLAIASDCNPGSAPSANLALAWALSCHQMKLTPMEALVGLTLNGAAALGASDRMGSIQRGKEAHVILTKPVSSLASLPYHFGENLVEHTFVFGQ